MPEYYRDEKHQFCDADLCMVIDTHTGEHVRCFPSCSSVGVFSEALDWLIKRGCRERNAIVKLNCVGAFPLDKTPKLD